MVTLMEPRPSSEEPRSSSEEPQPASSGKKNDSLKTAGLTLLMIIGGLTLMLYPTAAEWFAARIHNDEITSYGQAVSELSDDEREQKLDIAKEYNSMMPRGPLRDPFAVKKNSHDEQAAEDAAYAAYEEVLRVSENGVIGNISYPMRGIHLPLYHGTDDDVISKGAGHLYGSSLPVGGPSTHSVLTAHSGLANARLFTPLLQAEVGDEFAVEVLGEKHYYRVEHTLTVEPTDTSAMQIVEDRDYVTLLTCTPIGVNSHRFLVIGERIAAPTADMHHELPHVAVSAGFPWWIVALIAGTVFAMMATFGTGLHIFRKNRRKKNQAAAEDESASDDQFEREARSEPEI